MDFLFPAAALNVRYIYAVRNSLSCLGGKMDSGHERGKEKNRRRKGKTYQQLYVACCIMLVGRS